MSNSGKTKTKQNMYIHTYINISDLLWKHEIIQHKTLSKQYGRRPSLIKIFLLAKPDRNKKAARVRDKSHEK